MFNPLISNNFFKFCIIRYQKYTTEDVIDEIIDHLDTIYIVAARITVQSI